MQHYKSVFKKGFLALFLIVSTSFLQGCSFGGGDTPQTIVVTKEVNRPLPSAYLEPCVAYRTGDTFQSVIKDYRRALTTCNGQLRAIEKLTEKASLEAELDTKKEGSNGSK